MPKSAAQPEAGTNRTIVVKFTDMAYGGDAVGRASDSGLAVFAWPGITGETARVEVAYTRSNLARGIVTQVLEPSPLRIEPPCPYFGTCGGCQWQHIQYDGQVNFKHEILLSQLIRGGGITGADAVLKPPIAAPRPFNYRNTSHFAVDSAGRSLGYFRRDSHEVVPVSQCPISNEGINATIPLVNTMLAEAPGEDFMREGARGVMRVWQVTIRSSQTTGQTLVVFHSRAGGAAKAKLRGGQRRVHTLERPDYGPGPQPGIAGNPDIPIVRREVRRALYSLSHSGESNLALTVVEVMEDGTINLLGATKSADSLAADAISDIVSGSMLKRGSSIGENSEARPPVGAWIEKLGGRYYWIAPEAFFQANTEVAELLLSEVAAHIPRRMDLLVDAHAGVGTFALAFTERARQVIGFETSAAAVASARWSAAASGIANVEFQHGRTEKLLAKLPDSQRPDLVLLDPPRAGCQPELLAEVIRRHIPLVIYVSCDPSTLARDIKALSPAYNLKQARVIDMFPQTFHLETVAVLELME